MRPIEIVIGYPTPIPLLAKPVAAGFPSPADDFIEEEIDLQRLLIANRPATFLFRVKGDSMVEKKLHDGDLAVVDRSLEPRNGDVVVVDIDGERSFKVFATHRGRIELHFANKTLPPFPQPSSGSVDIWGVVSGSISAGRRAYR